MNIKKYMGILVMIAIAFGACKKDDETVAITPPPTVAEQEKIDDEALVNFLNTHYYTFDETQENSLIVFKKWEEGSGKTKLIDLHKDTLQTRMMTVANVEHKFYVLKVRGGGDENPKASSVDIAVVNYEGKFISDEVTFDSAFNPISFDLSGAIRGFYGALEGFSGANGSPVLGDDGIPKYGDDFGLGAVFMPSGLAYFDDQGNQIGRRYAPLYFSFKVLDVAIADHDNDGIPSAMEDADNSGSVRDDDTDGDTIVNYRDTDDDGDGKLTIDEILIKGTTIEFPDMDKDGVADYLDKDSK